jgi:hypothetical protein
MHPLQKESVGFGTAQCRPRNKAINHLDLQRKRNAGRDFILHLQDIT